MFLKQVADNLISFHGSVYHCCIVLLYFIYIYKGETQHQITSQSMIDCLRHTYCLKRVGKEGSLLEEKAGIRKAKILTIRELEEHAN